MLGLFGTLNLASRSLQTQMTGVEVTGQNIANVNTTSYTRQRVAITASPDLMTSIGPEGTGADATRIQQVVNSLLNGQIQSQGSTSGYWTAQQTALQTAQNGLGEFLNGTGSASSTSTTQVTDTSGSGLSAQLNTFFSSLSALTSSASDNNLQAVVGAAQNLATTFNGLDTQLNSLRDSLNTSLNNDVDTANQLLTEIADLNKQIASAEFGGGSANNLRDARQQDLENLAQLTSFTSTNGTNGAVNIFIGGQSLVTGSSVMDTLQTYDAGGGQYLVQTATGGVTLTLTSGSMQGTIDARDTTLAAMQTGLNTLAGTLITQVNAIHDSGYNATGGTGNTFFTGTGAADIGVNLTLRNNPSLMQLSGSATAGGDTSKATQLAALSTTTQAALGNQTFTGSYSATVAGLGSALSHANTQVANQQAVSEMLSTQRSSVSGVNVDEEMTNMITFQRAYQASARVVSTVDGLLNTLIQM
jgi:flagellar hook-associated protein 1 FlgK